MAFDEISYKLAKQAKDMVQQVVPENLQKVSDELASKVNQTDFNAKFGSMAGMFAFKGSDTWANISIKTDMIANDCWYDTTNIRYVAYNDTAWVTDIGNINIGKGSITPDKASFFNLGKNRFDKSKIAIGYFVSNTNGSIYANSNYTASDYYIEIEPLISYVVTLDVFAAFYTSTFTYISGVQPSDGKVFTSPANAKYIKISFTKGLEGVMQLEKGTVSTSYEAYGNYIIESSFGAETISGAAIKQNTESIKSIKIAERPQSLPKTYTLKDAVMKWRAGEKFPIGFFGDSTFEGIGTTWSNAHDTHQTQDTNAGGLGKVDYQNENAFPYLTQVLLREYCASSNLRVYNMGYSGTSAGWGNTNLKTILESGVYNDVKMVGLGHGINDRVYTSTWDFNYQYKKALTGMVQTLRDKGIQPFIITSQALRETHTTTAYASYPLRDSEALYSIVDKCKREVATDYNLELIELNDFGELIYQYSQYKVQDIGDDLHFYDLGHLLESRFMLSQVIPNTIDILDDTIVGFACQKIKSDIPYDKVNNLNLFVNGFKIKASYTKADTNDLMIYDFWVFNKSKKQVTLTAYVETVGSQYVIVDSVTTLIDSVTKNLGLLDIGVHHIQMYTGLSTSVNAYGFKITV